MNHKFNVYLIKNIVNGKYYVGYTKNFSFRWYSHCKSSEEGRDCWHLSRAIKLHGKESFEHEFLATNLTLDRAKELEKLWIIVLRSFDSEIGYNMTYGGDGTVWHLIPEERQKDILRRRSASLRETSKNPTEKMINGHKKVALKLKGKKGPVSPKKGRTHVEIFGEERALEISKKLSKSVSGSKRVYGLPTE